MGKHHYNIFKPLWLCLVLRKYRGKCDGKKMKMKIRRKEKVEKNKNRFKINKLFLYTILNSFYLFYLFYIKTK